MDPLFTKAQVDMQERIDILPQELTDLITDGSLDTAVYTLVQKHSLTEEQGKLLENEIILVLTLFFGPETFVDNVKESLGVDQATAEAIDAEVSENIFDLVADIFETVAKARKELNAALGKVDLSKKMEKREDLTKLQNTFAQPDPSRIQGQIAEDALSNVQPIRTMEQDMNRVHGYGAYREQIEKEEEATISSEDTVTQKN